MLTQSDLTVEIYDSANVRLIDADLSRAEGLQFDTAYPGGLYGAASFYVPRRVAEAWAVRGGQRVVFRRGLKIAYEGYLTNLAEAVSSNAQGVTLTAIGAWGAKVQTRKWRKRWADRRISDDIWVYDEGAAAALKCGTDRLNRLHFAPLTEQWLSGEYAAMVYTMPTGETCKRITFNWDVEISDLTKPSRVFKDIAGVFTDLTNTYDGSAATSDSVTLTTADYLYIGMHAGDTDRIQPGAAGLLKFNLTATVNTNAATMSVAQYWNGGAWDNLASFVDNTAAGGKTLAQDGTFTFVRPANWQPVAIGDPAGTVKMWLRFRPSAALTAVGIAEIDFGADQGWKLTLYNGQTAGDEFSQTTTGTGTEDITFATPTQTLQFRFNATLQQLAALGTVYGKITNVTVYGETGSITLTEIVKDCGGAAGARLNGTLSTSEFLIASNTFDLGAGGFIADDWSETVGEIMQRAESFGDSSYNRWAVGVRASDLAPDGKPILFAESYPALTDWDFEVSIAEIDGFATSTDYDGIWNWLIVRYKDEQGQEQYVTADDDANLTDATSSGLYGRRDYTLDASFTSLTNAKNLARRFLAANAYPQYHMARPVVLRETVRTKTGGGRVPVALVVAGKRVRVVDFRRDVSGVANTALTFLITQSTYDDDARAVTLSAGVPDDLSVLIAQIRM